MSARFLQRVPAGALVFCRGNTSDISNGSVVATNSASMHVLLTGVYLDVVVSVDRKYIYARLHEKGIAIVLTENQLRELPFIQTAGGIHLRVPT